MLVADFAWYFPFARCLTPTSTPPPQWRRRQAPLPYFTGGHTKAREVNLLVQGYRDRKDRAGFSSGAAWDIYAPSTTPGCPCSHLSPCPQPLASISPSQLTLRSLPLKMHCCFLSAPALHSSWEGEGGGCAGDQGTPQQSPSSPLPPAGPPSPCPIQPALPGAHLLVLPAGQEAQAAAEGEQGLSGPHVQRLAIRAQQKGCVVGDVFSLKFEDGPLFGAWGEEDGHDPGPPLPPASRMD